MISADESANWRVCGLRQIDRIVFALEDFARKANHSIEASIIWSDAVPPAERNLPTRHSSSGFAFSDSRDGDVTIDTRTVLARDSVTEALNGNRAAGKSLSSTADIPAAEKWLVRRLGKPQDGWVAKHIDRPISTVLTRVLLRARVKPLHATIGAFLFALAGCAVLLRGSYIAILTGTLLFYAFSILDGCDGEIARALYADSRAGAQLDLLFDTIANALFVISLGVGLTARSGEPLLFWEGVATAGLIAASELMLAGGAADVDQVIVARHSGIYDRHARMLGHSGAFVFGERAVRFVVQVTKRDVAWLAFVLLAAIDAAAWILHLSFIAALVMTVLAALAIIRRRAARQK